LKEYGRYALFAIDFDMSMLTPDIQEKIPIPLLREIEKENKNYGIFSEPWFIEEMKEAVDNYERKVPISAGVIFVNCNKKFCIALIGTHSNGFDCANGNGHTKEFRPTFFGVGAGESTALMIVTFIAGQHKNVANIEFEFDVKVRGFGCAVWSTLSIVYNDLARHFRGRSVI